MTDPPIERALGRLEGKVDSIIQEQREAREQRETQSNKFENMERVQTISAAKLDNVIARLEQVEPVISKFNNYEQRGYVVLAILGILATGSGVVVSFFVDKIMEWLGWK